MVCTEYNELTGWLSSFNGTDPLGAAVCPYVNDAGAGMPVGVMSLVVFGFFGLSLSVRAQHPGPIVVAGILSAGVIASTLPGIAAKIIAIVILFALVAAGMAMYQFSQSSL